MSVAIAEAQKVPTPWHVEYLNQSALDVLRATASLNFSCPRPAFSPRANQRSQHSSSPRPAIKLTRISRPLPCPSVLELPFRSSLPYSDSQTSFYKGPAPHLAGRNAMSRDPLRNLTRQALQGRPIPAVSIRSCPPCLSTLLHPAGLAHGTYNCNRHPPSCL